MNEEYLRDLADARLADIYHEADRRRLRCLARGHQRRVQVSDHHRSSYRPQDSQPDQHERATTQLPAEKVLTRATPRRAENQWLLSTSMVSVGGG